MDEVKKCGNTEMDLIWGHVSSLLLPNLEVNAGFPTLYH